ncbi:hypothetical protein [uncultured Porphyromonas sp.]|uniref:hypothetical protein n=1 Tax=uncultured Porphyromonas sp. TaxID=159274 RepID=UPI002804328F|nr:hypothetical protein [uncultured Porphyromonas sp.]
MKRYRYITLSLLLLLLSLSALSAQNHTYTLQDQGGRYEFEVETTPSYCENQGTLSVRLVKALAATSPQLNQIKEVKYNIKDKEGHSYTKVDDNNYYLPASTPDAALLVQSLPGREDYEIYVKITMWDNLNKEPIKTQLDGKIVVENKYVPLVLKKAEFDPYKLSCRPYGGFDIVVQGSEERPPVLTFEDNGTPATFTGAKTMQPTRKEIKDGDLLYHFEYNGSLPQGTYKYRFTNDCKSTIAKSFTIYGPKPDLPTVPEDLKMRFGIYVMDAGGCGTGISQFGVSSSSKDVLNKLFESINMGYKGDPNKPYPQYVDSFPSTFIKNYEVAVITQREYEELKKGALNVDNLLWSDQTGSPTKIEKGNINISYKLPQEISLQDPDAKKAFPGALLIRIKRPNTGCNDYITIPITVDLAFHKNLFQILETESTLDCSIGQIVWFQGWNFCSLHFNYYELPAGANEPAPGAQPVHTSEDFGPAVSTLVDKRYTFEKFDANKRYYVEIEGTDLYGNPITPKPNLIIEPTNKPPIENRLYDFYMLYVSLPDLEGAFADWYPYGTGAVRDPILLGPAGRIYMLAWPGGRGESLNALAGMDVTLVKAPEGYEDFCRTREKYYYRKPDESNSANPYGGGMIRLGETVKISTNFTAPSKEVHGNYFYPFKFLYKLGKDGERVVYPYARNKEDDPSAVDLNLLDSNPSSGEIKKYMEEHPMPRGIYSFKFEHPCQPGESFYIDIDLNSPDFKPILTEPIKPVVDYSSCSEVRVYPFADGRLDYGVDKKDRPRNLVFRVKGLTKEDKELYFFPKDATGKAIDHTKFYIPIKREDLPRTISFKYFYLSPNGQWIGHESHHKTKTVDRTATDVAVQADSLERNPDGYSGDFYLPIKEYNPNNDQEDWGKDGRYKYSSGKYATSYRWETYPFNPDDVVKVDVATKTPEPSYSRPTYVGYRCSKKTGYMEFKLINIPNGTGTVTLKDGTTVIKSADISTLRDMMVKWDLEATSGSELKKEYTLEIETTNCPEEGENTQKNFFKVYLLDTSEGIEVTILPRRGVCPGEKVTLTATNLGVSDGSYTWEITKAGEPSKTLTGRTVTCEVAAPRVVNGEVQYNTYTLSVDGTKCGQLESTGIIPVSPDELWWKPDLNGLGGGTLPGNPGEEETPTDPDQAPSDAKYCDWHNPGNWAFLHEGKFYPAKAVPTRCTNVHIMSLSQFDITTAQGTFRAQPDLAKDVTPRDLYGEPTCIDITFHSGAYVYNIQQLNYRRAMVRYNFGVANGTGTGYDSDMRIYTTEDCNTDEWMYGRDELNLLAAPLHDIYAGDYSFSASPYTYQLGFKAERAGKSMEASFDPSAFNDPSPLQSISMAGNNNCIALVVARDAQGFNRKGSTKSVITQRHGILELPYFDRPDIANSFYHQTYDASTGQTRFQYFDGKAKRFRGYYSYAQRSKMAYRFIFEDPATQRISKLAGGTEGYTMEVSATAAGQEVMVGNPFMTPLKADEFLKANESIIEPHIIRLVDCRVTTYEPKLTLAGSVSTYYSGITTPKLLVGSLEAFVVKLKSGVGPKAQLVFPTTALDSYAKLHPQSTSSLRSTSGDATAETARYLSLTLQSLLGKDRTLVAYGYESGSVDKMLLSTESRYPSIAIIDPADGLHKDLYADDAATGHYELATQVSEPIDVTLSLAGSVMGHVVTARLIDHKSGLEHDLTGGKSCQIKLFPDDTEGRLELRVDGDFTSVAPMAEPTDELQAQYSEGMLTVRTAQEMSSLRLVQGDGITVYTQSLPGLTEYSERILLSSGSYVVEAIGTDGVARRATLVVK